MQLGIAMRPCQFEDAVGKPERFELRCDNRHYRTAFETAKKWRVPDSWGACSVFVFGEPGTTFKLVEFPRPQSAAPG